MALRVIEGGLAVAGWENARQVDEAQVGKEGARRLRESGYDRLEARRRVTGLAVPRSLDYFRMQIEFVVSALSRLEPIPPDFRNDRYWPVLDSA
ncbi:hypothetical protein SB748_24950 [Rhizobium sp. SIMBA_035]